jgi:hypothetical protein
MGGIDRKSLLALFGTRFDTYSAKVVLDEALEKAGMSGRDPLSTADLALLAPLLKNLRTRMDYVAAEVERLAGGAKPAVAAAPEPVAAPAPAPVPTPKPAAAVAPAAAPAPLLAEVAAGAAKEAAVAGRGPFRITAAEAGTVRWGVNGWKAPPAAAQPEGTAKVPNEPTVDTALAAAGAGFALVLGPFDAAVQTVEFTVRHAGDKWAPPCAVKLGAGAK